MRGFSWTQLGMHRANQCAVMFFYLAVYRSPLTCCRIGNADPLEDQFLFSSSWDVFWGGSELGWSWGGSGSVTGGALGVIADRSRRSIRRICFGGSTRKRYAPSDKKTEKRPLLEPEERCQRWSHIARLESCLPCATWSFM